ncbi:hypothetical protein ACWDTI_15650 [Gordonia sp. NPDC003424]
MAKLSPQVSAVKATHWKQRLAPHLAEGEVIRAFASACRLKPATEGVAFTNARVIGFNTDSASSDGTCVAVSVTADDILGYDLTPVHLVPTISIHASTGMVNLGTFDKAETDFIAYFLESLQQGGVDPAAQAGIDALQEEESVREKSETCWEEAHQSVPVFGEPMTVAQWATVQEHAPAHEVPWLVLNSGRAGQLVAFDDRVVLLKRGYPSDPAGAVHDTTVSFSELIAIEYNCGALTGDLELLTPDHPGCGPRDHWLRTKRDEKTVSYGSTAMPNALSFPKPYYRQALPMIEDLRRRIADTREPGVSGALRDASGL